MFIVDSLTNLGPLDGLSVHSKRVHSQTSIIEFAYRQANRWGNSYNLARSATAKLATDFQSEQPD